MGHPKVRQLQHMSDDDEPDGKEDHNSGQVLHDAGQRWAYCFVLKLEQPLNKYLIDFLIFEYEI